MTYVEPGGSWRPFWPVAGVVGLLVVVDLLLPGRGVPSLVLALAGCALGAVLGHTLMVRRAWTVRVDAEGADAGLTVGRERVPLADVDAAHLRAVTAGTAGADAGAAVLGGGGSLPRGRAGLPLRLIDGRTVLVPTRDPAALTTALLAALRDTPDGSRGRKGTLGS
ncbi:hypothetical protein [Geodermatophilus sp. CPCC 205506]|uniref:hypothetical protein n=1 Tax=Geodermatophilus sp. CPCC 205506 TaxID=2936596 RepID=UPI003EEA8EB3